MPVFRSRTLPGLLIALTLLAGCGGGGGSSSPAASPSNTSPSSSVGSSASSSSTATSSSSASSGASAFSCNGSEWFCDDFQSASTSKWVLLPSGGGATIGTANGAISVITEGANQALQYDAGSSKGVVAEVSNAAFANVTSKATADYYVEAKIRPISNAATNKYICLLGRYIDPNNWNGACLNVQNSASSKVEFHKSTSAGGWNRTKQFSPSRTILADVWYKLRLEMVGSAMTLYIDDELVGTQVDTSNTAAGKIGIWMDNKSFVIDDVVVGDASIKPVLLSISPTTAWNAELGDADKIITVAATKSDASVDTYTAISSNPAVVSVSNVTTATGGTTTLKALGAGSAIITFTSGSKPSLTKTLSATIAPAFVMPTSTYGTITAKTIPAVGATAAYVDETLALTFDSAPAIGTAGSIRIFKSSDDSLVDTIKLAGETDLIGPSKDLLYRGLNTPLVKVIGNKLLVKPHTGKLQYGTQYYVAIANGTITNAAALNGSAFTGIGKTANWNFTTKAAPASTLTTVTVDDDGTSADFRSVQGAINFVMSNVPASTPATIEVKDGIYSDPLYVRAKDNLTIHGQSRSGTVIAIENFDGRNAGTGKGSAGTIEGGRSAFLIENADLLTLDNLTLQNTYLKVAGASGTQSEVIYYSASTQRLIAKNVDFIGRQDTILVNGYAWFYNSLIAGDVDFIWGSAKAALFENSEIRSRVDSSDPTKGGYLVQARVTALTDKGYVFLNSAITRESGVPDSATVLARSAGGSTQYDNVVYVNCKLDGHISAAGWLTSPVSNPGTATATTGWREYGSTKLDGTALDTSARIANARTLSSGEAAPYLSRAQVFSAISWNPSP